ncbi:putative DNA-binding protein [Bacteroides zoogleoformans]|nr:RNA-binding domain-containing protein [Bacteroides zoogleoformans]TWJ11051.1 putative DNA-binding protein [Bacteroides zoogleoformans]
MEQNKLTPMQAYKIGDVIDYKVRSLFTTYCELIDEKTGIKSYLQGTARLVLFKGQTVKCRILAVSEKHPKIELMNISAFEQSKHNLTEEKLTGLLESRGIAWNTKEFVKILLTEEKEKSFETQCHRWIQNLLNKKTDLQTVRKDCSDLLELSDLLNICSHNERDFYQERLTLIIEQTGYYIRATELINNEAKEDTEDTPTLFIDNLFNKLKVSGFVYHPSKNFSILSSLFLCKPELMNNRMKELLDIISDKNIQIWEREPFGSALIKLLDLYIRECDGKIDKTKENKVLIDNNMLALAIQLLLIKDSKISNIADYRLNAARLCLLSSYLYPSNPGRLVNAAYSILFNSNAKLPAYTIEKVMVLPHYIFSSSYDNIDTVNSFSQGNGRLLISEKGIHLQSAGEKGNLRPVFPNELRLWKNLQVFLLSKPKTSLTSVKPNDITPYQSVWSEIETEFFDIKKRPVVIANKNKKQHRTGETVKITFTGQDVNYRDKYFCQIEDEIGGNGFICVDDIVPYSISTSLRHFYASDGSRLIFQALIIDKEDDLFRFSMLEDLKTFFSDNYYDDDEDIICSVGNVPNNYGMAPAITKEGVSVSIRNAGNFEGIEKNSIVRCRLIGAGSGTFHIACDILGFTSFDFDLNTAFKNLMEACSLGKISENITQQEEEQILESDNLIDESYVKEVIYLIDRMALIDTEYVKSFNYLGFARILCLLIGWESQAAYYKGRMDIIVMLHDFAQNSKVDEEKLTQLEHANAELFSNNAVLRERFMQLQTVSFIGKVEHNADLFNLASSNPYLKNLASLVLAYNITKSNGLESSATNIHNKIIQLLNLKGYETGLKLYGTGEENEETEYKTSIVFFAEDNGSFPNQVKQMDEILKVINSFFNTRGGTLYIGVNNFGYGVSVEEDLKTSLYYGDKDKYSRSIVDAVASTWGNRATTYINKIGFDEENTDKNILIIEVLPIPSGLPYNEHWYIRKAGSKRKLTEIEFNEYQKLSRKLHTAPSTEEISEEMTETNQEPDNAAMPLITSKDYEIMTSRIRKNVLSEWDDPENYVEPIGFFKFLNSGKFKKIDDYDFDDASLLTLVVKESEKTGYMVLGYDNGHIVKVPVEELLEYTNREYSRNTESKLIFASLANENDAVITVSKENKTRPKVVMRLDRLSGFEEGRLMDSGEMPYNEGLVSRILAYDVIPDEYIEDFNSILDKPKTSTGSSKNFLAKDMVNKLHLWGIKEI